MLLRLSLMDPAAMIDQNALNVNPTRLHFKLQSRSEGITNMDCARLISLEEMFYDNFNVTNKDNQGKPTSIKAQQFVSEFVDKLKSYRLVEEPQPGVFVLQQKFAHNIVSMLSTNLKLELKKPKNKETMADEEERRKWLENQEERARKKWLNLTGYMLNIDRM